MRNVLNLTGIVLSFLTVACLSNTVRADLLYATEDAKRNPAHFFKFLNDTDNNGWHYAESIVTTNADTEQVFRAFCVDRGTYTSEGFNDPTVGQEYGATTLNSPTMTLYTQTQKEALNQLFSYVYSSVYDSFGNVIGDLASYVFQLAVWEIVHETSGTYSVTAGEFGVSSGATYRDPDDRDQGSVVDNTFYNQATALANSWFDAMAGNVTWESLGYTSSDYELYVYVAEGGTHASQTLISTVGPAATPEPGTLLIFGLGAAAIVPWARRRIKSGI